MTRLLFIGSAYILAFVTVGFSFSDSQLSHSLTTGTTEVRQQPSPSPTPRIDNGAMPVVSPDGLRIAFTSNRSGAADVYVIDVDGRHERQLTRTPDAESNLAWTRDGRVLFATFKDDISHLYASDLSGNNQRKLAEVRGRGPILSPDGRRLVYMAGTWTATKLMVVNIDGSNAQQITDGSSIAWNNRWSPNGKLIAFTGREAPQSQLAVFVMNADGSSRRQVSNIPPDEGAAQWPVWSPNGRQLAIQVNSRKQNGSAHIWIVDFGMGNARKLAPHDRTYLDETPSWFPDGKRIAFQSNHTGRMEVWVMSVDGTGARQVTGAR